MTSGSETLTKLRCVSAISARWYCSDGRRYPWRESSNPYYVLVAEVLLRKTQVFRVSSVFAAFVGRYPSFHQLAKADPVVVRGMVAPLGLPERGPQLVEIARDLEASGREIESGHALERFRGVGPYIANAVECLAFRRPVPLVDGAVGRLLRRVFELNSIKPAYAEKSLWKLAQEILDSDPESCKEISLGLLDIAAIYCKPKKPACSICPLEKVCAYASTQPRASFR